MWLSGMFNLRNAVSVTHKHYDGVNTHNAKYTNILSGRFLIEGSLFVMLFV